MFFFAFKAGGLRHLGSRRPFTLARGTSRDKGTKHIFLFSIHPHVAPPAAPNALTTGPTFGRLASHSECL